jgi:hypothetical protein
VIVALSKAFNNRSLQPRQLCPLKQSRNQIPLEDRFKIFFRSLIREKFVPLF